ncbi:hypothetical protein QYE76_045848 [Lolium multiflorum]|uniref:Uncharacterized protein n=1 Tax=Lolium multiflorum TaxID=4521 RepID=A0AAD8TLV3_LOLMU|nr:hypothetical protein QYE76_045848 [Lolium multiflorum]
MIRPCFLPVGMSTSNRIIKPGDECYQPVVAGRQFGLGQVSPHFFLHHLKVELMRDVLTGQVLTNFLAVAYNDFYNLVLSCSNKMVQNLYMMTAPLQIPPTSSGGPLLQKLTTLEEGCDAEPADFTKIGSQESIFWASCPPSLNQGENGSEKSSCQEDLEAPKPYSSSRKFARLHRRQLQRGDTVQSKGFKLGQLRENHHAEPARFATIGFKKKTDDTSSGEVEEVLMPSATLDLATSKSVADKVANLAKPTSETQEPITSSSAIPLGYDLSSLLTFDPESIEPATSRASEESGPSATHGQLQRLKALLSSSIETLVENPEEVKSILEDIQPHLPVTLQVKLVVTLSAFRSRVKSARQRIDLRHAQLPLKADIADKCQRLNEKKAALDAKTDTSVSTGELEALRKELEDLEERVRATKKLIHDKEALITRSQEEAEGLKAELKTDLAEIRALNRQLVTGKDEDDEAKIAEVDRVRADALQALEAFLQ